MIDRISNGRTDLVFDWLTEGHPARSTDKNGVSLLQWCAYYGDVAAMRHVLTHGEALSTLGENFGLHGAAFHGHWQLCQFLIEQGADVNFALTDSGETSLHAALCKSNSLAHERVVKVLITRGADPNRVTLRSARTDCFMRDCRTRAETPLHRAAAFGTSDSIRLLLDAGARVDAKDMNGDSPLAWASWHLRPDAVLRMLCYGEFAVRPDRNPGGMEADLLGTP